MFKELLIGVTGFYRDPEAFELLKEQYLFKLLHSKPDGYHFRIWIPGCSSGEEVYSIAMIFQEYLQTIGRDITVQLFGTDLDHEAIGVARAGIYPNTIAGDVSPERLDHFFTKVDDCFQIKKNIRELVIFAEHNVIKDPPFTKLDMLCCRNLLIYFGSELQAKLLPIFHYSLQPEGLLLLGSSENIGRSTDQFTLLDKKWKIFERRRDRTGIPSTLQLSRSDYFHRRPGKHVEEEAKAIKDTGTANLLKAILNLTNVPVCVVVDDKAELIYAHGRTGHFLEPAEGEVSNSILRMARPGLKAALIKAIKKMADDRSEVICENLRVRNNGSSRLINLIVKPMQQSLRGARGLMLIIFEEISGQGGKKVESGREGAKPVKTADYLKIEDELLYARENLQITVEELETSNEELTSTNEELQSANEELQSTNEELETSKEELQSLNEEASTVNSELQLRIDELTSANDDIQNLLDAVNIATIFLDNQLKIRRFTPSITNFFHLTPTDIGRSIEHFASSLVDVNIKELSRLVLRTLDKHESVIEDTTGQKYRLRIHPFRTANNAIEGIVITFDDISEYVRMVDTLAENEKTWQELVH